MRCRFTYRFCIPPISLARMKAAFIRIAIAKTADAGELAALSGIETAAIAFETADASFAERIEANKALRGEAPTKLRKSTREQLDALASDQADLDADLIAQLGALDSASSVIGALTFALTQDIPRARAMLKHYPAPDYPLGEEMVLLKERLADAMQRYLSVYADED
jgi:hypothetical protein